MSVVKEVQGLWGKHQKGKSQERDYVRQKEVPKVRQTIGYSRHKTLGSGTLVRAIMEVQHSHREICSISGKLKKESRVT